MPLAPSAPTIAPWCGLEAAGSGRGVMAIRLNGKVALVTAASEGLGFACARRLVDEVVKSLGRIDFLVLNSGHVDYGGLEELDDDQWRHAFDLLLMSAVRLTRHCIPIMRTNGGATSCF